MKSITTEDAYYAKSSVPHACNAPTVGKNMTTADPREAEWRQYEAEQLAKGRCPYSGEVLHRDGDAGPDAASCDLCDCFGYDPEQVKVWPRPLRVVRGKVTRMKCPECGRSFAGDKWTKVCAQCFDKTLTALQRLSWPT